MTLLMNGRTEPDLAKSRDRSIGSFNRVRENAGR